MVNAKRTYCHFKKRLPATRGLGVWASACDAFSPPRLLIHNSQHWQSESSTSSSDKSRGYHSSAAIFRIHLLWLTSIFQPLFKLGSAELFPTGFSSLSSTTTGLRIMFSNPAVLGWPLPRAWKQGPGLFLSASVCVWIVAYELKLGDSHLTSHNNNGFICIIKTRARTYIISSVLHFLPAPAA